VNQAIERCVLAMRMRVHLNNAPQPLTPAEPPHPTQLLMHVPQRSNCREIPKAAETGTT